MSTGYSNGSYNHFENAHRIMDRQCSGDVHYKTDPPEIWYDMHGRQVTRGPDPFSRDFFRRLKLAAPEKLAPVEQFPLEERLEKTG